MENACKGYQNRTKTQQMSSILNLSHKAESVKQEMCKYVKYICYTLYFVILLSSLHVSSFWVHYVKVD